MFSAVLKYGSSLIYGETAENSEVSRVPATDGAERRKSLVDNLDENWVIIGDVSKLRLKIDIFYSN